jgi:hypothetical protein
VIFTALAKPSVFSRPARHDLAYPVLHSDHEMAKPESTGSRENDSEAQLRRRSAVKRLAAVFCLMAAPAMADTVHLKGGGQIRGVIVERTEDSVTVDIGGGGTVTARMSSVVRIEEDRSPLQDFRERADAIPEGDVEAWRELARWATDNALMSQALRAYSEVVAVLPDDEEANRALGRVKVNGQWMSEEENYRSRGYVRFEGQWMTPEEQRRIQADRQSNEAAAQQANEAKIAELETEIAEDRRRKEEEMEAVRRRNDVGWGWGSGPDYWPRPGIVVWPAGVTPQ